MTAYQPPLADIRFVIDELLPKRDWLALPGNEELSDDLLDAVLAEAGRFCAQVLAPLNQSGDAEGCHLDNGVVRTPAGFREAYRAFAAGGWTALAGPPEHGGQGLPEVLAMAVMEMQCAANLAFSMYPGLSHGACNAIEAHAEERLARTWLPPLLAGRFSGTMCLTEPHCGTDLGLVRSRAEPREDGSHAVSGTKIFISAGEHDLTDNIVHLVLARLPDAPPGTKGISLFLVPKFLLDADGNPGERNTLRCARLEHKMGIRASATCEMVFDGATGWLVGTPNKGMRAMFTMMNAARLAVGLQGVGLAEVAYQNAVAYARERLQGRAPSGARAPAQAADPILAQPDVRRMLLTMRAWTEGGRALSLWVAERLDVANRHPDAAERRRAEDFVSLLTPVVKAFLTDLGSEAANLGVQVWGGHGYIVDNGMEQLVRDARIAQIYEGTNGVQAMDLVGRKLPAHAGRYLRAFFHPVRAWLATGEVARTGLRDPDAAAAVATDYLRLFGLVAMGWCFADMAERAAARLAGGEGDPVFLRAKLETARFFTARLLPQTGALLSSVMAGGTGVDAFEDAAF